jgi:hypothetical protein
VHGDDPEQVVEHRGAKRGAGTEMPRHELADGPLETLLINDVRAIDDLEQRIRSRDRITVVDGEQEPLERFASARV